MPANEPIVLQLFDITGKPHPGGKLYSYVGGDTTTPQAIYADAELTTPLDNPVVCDGAGRKVAYLDASLRYDLVAYTADDGEILIPKIIDYQPREDSIMLAIGNFISTAVSESAANAAEAAANALLALGYKTGAETAKTGAEAALASALAAASTAASQATTATTQAAAAAASASAASGSASAATAAASAASDSATTASTAAANAATSEANAAESESNAADSKTEALASEVAALGAMVITTEKVLGQFANIGEVEAAYPLVKAGALYWNTSVSTLHVVLTDAPGATSAAAAGAIVSVNGQTGVVDLDAGDIPITDSGGNFTATDVEAALAELAETPAQVSVDTLSALSALAANYASYVVMLNRASAEDGGFGIFDWLPGDQSSRVSADPLQGLFVAPSSDTSGASGCWARRVGYAARSSWFGVLPGTVTIADWDAMLTTIGTITGLKTRTLLLDVGVYTFGSKPAIIDDEVRIVGAGLSYTNLVRNYSEAGGNEVAFIHFKGESTANSNISDVQLSAGASTTGGTMLKWETNTDEITSWSDVERIVISPSSGNYAWALVVDGTANTISGSQGLRDLRTRDSFFFAGTQGSALFKNATNGGHTNFWANGAVTISGGGSSLTNTNDFAMTGARIFGTLTIEHCVNVFISGAVQAVTINSTASKVLVVIAHRGGTLTNNSSSTCAIVTQSGVTGTWGGSVSDGDKGDVTVSSSGTVWTVDAFASASQGNILYYNGSAWSKLAPGTSGQYLMTQGAGANPQWGTISNGSLTDGDKGDIVVSSSGSVWTLDSAASARLAALGLGGSIPSPSNTTLYVTSTNASSSTAPDLLIRKQGENTFFSMHTYSSDTATEASFMTFNRVGGTVASPSQVLDTWLLGAFSFAGRNPNGNDVSSATVQAYVNGTPSGDNIPTELRFYTNNGTALAQRMTLAPSGRLGLNEAVPDYLLDVNGSFGFSPGSSVTPVDNGDVVFELTNNTTLTVKAKGSDGTVRSGTITLS